MTPRRVVLGLVGAAAVVGWVRYAPTLAGAPDLTPIPDLPGFRRLGGGAASSGAAVFAGLEPAPPAIPPGNLCTDLFAPPVAGAVPVALFTDPFCPNCRSLERKLSALGKSITLRRHQVPVLGPDSDIAARLLLAGEALGLPQMRGNPDPRRLALASGHDLDRLQALANGPEVSHRLAQARGLYTLFGFVGSPGLVLGRTAVNGDLPDRQLRALMTLERSATPACTA